MIDVKPYSEGDVHKADWREPMHPSADEVFVKGCTYTILWHEEVIAVIHFQMMWEGVAQVATLVSDSVAQCPSGFTTAVETALTYHCADSQVRKVYAIVDATIPRNSLWIESLGFEKEYIMVAGGPKGQDMVGFAKVVGADYVNSETQGEKP